MGKIQNKQTKNVSGLEKMDITTDKAFAIIAEVVEKNEKLTNDQKIKFCSEYMKIFDSVLKEVEYNEDPENLHSDQNKMEVDTAEVNEEIDEDDLEQAELRYLATLATVTNKRKTYPLKLKQLLGKSTRNQMNAVQHQAVSIAPHAHLEVEDDIESMERQIKSQQEICSHLLSDAMVNIQPNIERLKNQGDGLNIVYCNRNPYK